MPEELEPIEETIPEEFQEVPAEPTEEIPEEEAPKEVVREKPLVVPRPKSDVWTLLLILTFIIALATIIIAGIELNEFYDVSFWIFQKPK
jgi:hypothetical protein